MVLQYQSHDDESWSTAQFQLAQLAGTFSTTHTSWTTATTIHSPQQPQQGLQWPVTSTAKTATIATTAHTTQQQPQWWPQQQLLQWLLCATILLVLLNPRQLINNHNHKLSGVPSHAESQQVKLVSSNHTTMILTMHWWPWQLQQWGYDDNLANNHCKSCIKNAWLRLWMGDAW